MVAKDLVDYGQYVGRTFTVVSRRIATIEVRVVLKREEEVKC